MPAGLCQSRKRGHNAIEKRYRTDLNDKISCLRIGIPALRRSTSSSESSDEVDAGDPDGEDAKKREQKHGKAAVLTRALEYIHHLEYKTEKIGSDVDSLNLRVGACKKLAMSGGIVLSNGIVATKTSTKTEAVESIQAGKLPKV